MANRRGHYKFAHLNGLKKNTLLPYGSPLFRKKYLLFCIMDPLKRNLPSVIMQTIWTQFRLLPWSEVHLNICRRHKKQTTFSGQKKNCGRIRIRRNFAFHYEITFIKDIKNVHEMHFEMMSGKYHSLSAPIIIVVCK